MREIPANMDPIELEDEDDPDGGFRFWLQELKARWSEPCGSQELPKESSCAQESMFSTNNQGNRLQ